MPETKRDAEARAKKLAYPKSTVVKGTNGYFIAQLGVDSSAGKKAYANCRSEGKAKGYCAAVSHTVDKKSK